MSTKFVVAIGYSEGGLEPISTFFDHVPHDHVTYVILRHIPVGQRSLIGDILQRHSKLKIMEVEDGMSIENDVVYIPSSTSYLTIADDKLYLHPRVHDSRNYNYSVNTFLESLAVAKGEKAVAVILSGNGVDGAVGVTQIHERGGLVIAQEPASCENPGMPENAIGTNCVHHVLPPSDMPGAIARHILPLLKRPNVISRLNES